MKEKARKVGGSVSIGTKNLQHELLSKDKPELFKVAIKLKTHASLHATTSTNLVSYTEELSNVSNL